MIDSAIQLGVAQLPTGLDPQTMASSNAIAQQVSTSEWLGPMAPIALSPFFGLCALSGIATYGPEWLQDRSALFSDASLLDSPWLFWTMLVLSIITSLPRLTKVSKPIALAAENLETYSAVIVLIAMRMLTDPGAVAEVDGDLGASADSERTLMLSAGVASFSANAMMSVFSALNIIVINAVKLFCEFVIWLVPIPAIDALVEFLNKFFCVGLISLYCYSPTVATTFNLLLLVGCALVFNWTRRRLRFYREVIVGPVLAWLMPGWFAQRGDSFVAFCESRLLGFPRFTPVKIRKLDSDHFHVSGRWLWRKLDLQIPACKPASQPGLLIQQLELVTQDGERYVFSHRRWIHADECCEATHTTAPEPA